MVKEFEIENLFYVTWLRECGSGPVIRDFPSPLFSSPFSSTRRSPTSPLPQPGLTHIAAGHPFLLRPFGFSDQPRPLPASLPTASSLRTTPSQPATAPCSTSICCRNSAAEQPVCRPPVAALCLPATSSAPLASLPDSCTTSSSLLLVLGCWLPPHSRPLAGFCPSRNLPKQKSAAGPLPSSLLGVSLPQPLQQPRICKREVLISSSAPRGFSFPESCQHNPCCNPAATRILHHPENFCRLLPASSSPKLLPTSPRPLGRCCPRREAFTCASRPPPVRARTGRSSPWCDCKGILRAEFCSRRILHEQNSQRRSLPSPYLGFRRRHPRGLILPRFLQFQASLPLCCTRTGRPQPERQFCANKFCTCRISRGCLAAFGLHSASFRVDIREHRDVHPPPPGRPPPPAAPPAAPPCSRTKPATQTGRP